MRGTQERRGGEGEDLYVSGVVGGYVSRGVGGKRMWIILLISSWGRYVGKGRECVHMLDKGAQYT